MIPMTHWGNQTWTMIVSQGVDAAVMLTGVVNCHALVMDGTCFIRCMLWSLGNLDTARPLLCA